MWSILLFVLFGGLAVGCAVAVVAQRNALYSAVALVGVFVALACLYMTLAAPFIAAVQVIVYAGAIMVLVVFVIMLLNVEEEVRPVKLHHMIAVGVLLGAALAAETFFMLTASGTTRVTGPAATDVGVTASIGTGLFTEYLLPFEVTSVLILMALVGAITLARQTRGRPAGGGGEEVAAAVEATGGGGRLQPGRTDETGRAFARYQIETGEAAAPAGREARPEQEEKQ